MSLISPSSVLEFFLANIIGEIYGYDIDFILWRFENPKILVLVRGARWYIIFYITIDKISLKFGLRSRITPTILIFNSFIQTIYVYYSIIGRKTTYRNIVKNRNLKRVIIVLIYYQGSISVAVTKLVQGYY